MARSHLDWTIKDVPIKTRFGTIYATPTGEQSAHLCTRPSRESGAPEGHLTLRAIPYYVSHHLVQQHGVWTAPLGQYGQIALPYATRQDHAYGDASKSAKETLHAAIASAFAAWAETHSAALLEAERIRAHNALRSAELALEEAMENLRIANADHMKAQAHFDSIQNRYWGRTPEGVKV